MGKKKPALLGCIVFLVLLGCGIGTLVVIVRRRIAFQKATGELPTTCIPPVGKVDIEQHKLPENERDTSGLVSESNAPNEPSPKTSTADQDPDL